MNSSFQKTALLGRRIKGLAVQTALVFQVPFAWLRSLWASRELLDGRWSRTIGFRPKNALNNFYYRIQRLNIDRYGRTGRSPLVGFGNYPMSRWFHITNLSHFAYANAGATVMLVGTLGWALGHLVWADTTITSWAILITATLALSSTSYAMAFVYQNYNVLGWLWVPIALFAINSEFWIVAAFAWFLASLASITVIFVAVPLMTVYALTTGQYEAAWALVPAVVKIGFHVRPMLADGGVGDAFAALGKLIGLIPTQVRYKRTSMRFDLKNTYLSLLYLGGCLLLWPLHGVVPWLPLTATGLFVVNQRLVRFADTQSVVILVASGFTAYTLAMAPGPLQWLVLLIVANPLPYFFGIVETDGLSGRRRIAIFRPFDHTKIEKECKSMLQAIPTGNRILFVFKDPQGVYENLFDGYRSAIEPFLYVAARHGIHLFPDWHAVAESNNDRDFHVWGRTLDEVRANREHWQADHVLYYLASDEELPGEWLEQYRIVGSFDYANHLEDLEQAVPWSGGLPCPKFLLLEPVLA